jgi:hypothetical protein
MVEAAVAFPLLVMVALGLVQFAIAFHAHNVVEAAVQDGARMAAGSGCTGADSAACIQAGLQHTNQLLQAGLGSHVHDVGLDTTGSSDDAIQINAHGSFDTFIPWFGAGGLTHLSIPLEASAIVSREHFRPSP